MTVDAIRAFCMSLPHATEQVQWVRDLVFKIGGKMFCVMNLEPERDETLLSFKVTDEEFVGLQENEGVVPAPYMAKNKWVALERWDALASAELKRLLKQSYELVLAKLPKKERAKLQQQVSFGVRLRTGSRLAPRRFRKKGATKNRGAHSG